MPKYRHLSSAPITEALFDFRVKARDDLEVEELKAAKGKLASQLPNVEERVGGRLRFEFRPPEEPTTEVEGLGVQGYFLFNEDRDMIAQFRLDGFTFNKLPPYSDWDLLFPLAMDLWDEYVQVAKPVAITRQAVRYINHIKIQATRLDFDDYFRAAPQVPDELPQSISGFSHRTTIVNPDLEIAAHVLQVFDPKPNDEAVTVILDIDCFKNVEFDASSTDEIQSVFSDLREFKNLIFFNFVTDKTLEMYE